MATNLPASTTVSPEQQRVNELRSFLTRGAASLAMAIPKTLAKHLTPERMIQLAITATRRNPKLLECDPLSIAASLVEASQLGLQCDGILGEGYLVPRWSKKAGRMLCSFQPGYRGLINLARRTGTVETIDAEAVFDGDHFEYAKGLSDKLEHISASTKQTEVTLTHVWALIRFKGGGYQFKVMTKAQVETIRTRSQSQDQGPWQTDYAAMAVKTVIRQLMKLCDLSPEVARTVSVDESLEVGAIDPKDIQPGDELPMLSAHEPEPAPTPKPTQKQKPKPEPEPEPDADPIDIDIEPEPESEPSQEYPEPEPEPEPAENRTQQTATRLAVAANRRRQAQG